MDISVLGVDLGKNICSVRSSPFRSGAPCLSATDACGPGASLSMMALT
jgi:hypothetical protein